MDRSTPIRRQVWPIFPARSLVCFILLAAVVTASDALPTPSKRGPAGIFILLPEDRGDRPSVDFSKLPADANPTGDGLALRTFWDKVEPTEGRRNWAYFDDGLAWAKRQGRKVSLSLAAGIWSPVWVLDAPARTFEVSLTSPAGQAQTKTMPLPWDPVFQKKWRATLMDFGRRYDSDPGVSYVVIGGLGFLIESYVAKTPGDIRQFQSLGGVSAWLDGAKKVVDVYAEAFPSTPFVLAMGPPIPTADGMDALLKLVDYGMQTYPGRFGIAHHGLDARSTMAYPPFAAIERYSSRSPAGFQMVWSTHGPNAGLIHGTLDEALDRAVALKAHFVEVYLEDCRDPAYTAVLKSASVHLRANAAALE